ncbi:MAG: hypothetical protein KDA25_10550, partial [Phycisphaerales bacterium]|nr:hypothetical protein [Phycisphaerales bacterium]
LVPAETNSGDGFGESIAVRGDVAVVGAPFDDDRGTDAGCIYLFAFDGALWQLTEKVTASDGEAGDHFGMAVDAEVVGGMRRIAVGAPGARKAYVFEDFNGVLTQVAELPVPGGGGDEFGTSISVDGDLLAVGDPGRVTVFSSLGTVTVYQRGAGGVWALFHDISSPVQDALGSAVDIDGLRMLVTGGFGSIVFAYETDGNSEFALIGQVNDPSLTGTGFGTDLSSDGQFLAIGSPDADPIDTGLDAGETLIGNVSGAPGAWTFDILRPSDGDAGDRFGASVAVSGDQMIIGAPGDDDIAFDAGAAYLYQRVGGNVWIPAGKIYSTSAEPYDAFGSAAALDSMRGLVSAEFADNEGAIDAGATYAFSLADCNANGLIDGCDIALGLSEDCNVNRIPDECEILSGDATDIDGDGVLDECEDCNGNGLPDDYEIDMGMAQDCNENGLPDDCDLTIPPVNLVFAMDTSGSMDDEAAAICNAIFDVVEDLSDRGITVLPELYGITKAPGGDFSCLTDTVLGTLGADVPGSPTCCPLLGNDEDWGPATAIIAERYPWMDGAIRIIVPVSDEGPRNGSEHIDDDDQEVIDNAIVIASENGVVVSPIVGTGGEGVVFAYASQLAAGTGGTAIQFDPDADVAAAIAEIVLRVVSLDCNQNGVPDECDIANGIIPDCNDNGVADACEVNDGLVEDCNGNEIPDECEAPFIDAQSTELGPIGAGSPQAFLIVGAPLAGSDVTLTILAVGDFSAALETVDIAINGTSVGTFVGAAGVDCPGEPTGETIVVPAATYNAAIGANAVFTLTASGAVDPTACSGENWISIRVRYQAISADDCDGNGMPDDCDIAADPSLDLNENGQIDACEGGAAPCDFNADGHVDAADLAFLLSQWGPCSGCPADLDGDGIVGPGDLAILLSNWG